MSSQHMQTNQPPEKTRATEDSRTISIAGLKALVRDHFPKDSTLRHAILEEGEKLSPQELAWKLEVWMNILNHEK
ncbi:MAG: hypothetical protein E3J35_10025 [Methanomassiliicoccales archaeon]|nr:MAG: hypothetical protein E3J35_10025 [Methanomassiliicoccales archaeon]